MPTPKSKAKSKSKSVRTKLAATPSPAVTTRTEESMNATAAAVPAVTNEEVRRIAQEECARIGLTLAANDKALKEAFEKLAKRQAEVLRFATAEGLTPQTRARLSIAASSPTENPILNKLAAYYTPGQESPANVLLTSPPSLGKSFATRQLGQGYDKYMEHGCSDDIDEVATLLGGPVPDGKGGFLMVDGVLTEAVRSASAGSTVLLLLDEVLRLSPRAQEWLLTFLTGVKTPTGRIYRLRTRRAMENGNLEVIECETRNLHIVGATNLGLTAPVEAFWSRWETVRVDFSPALAQSTAAAILAAYGIEDKGGRLARVFSDVVAESRKLTAEGRLRFPVDFRLLERATQLAPDGNRKAVADWMAARLQDNTANWNVDTGDVDPDSTASIVPLVTKLASVEA